MMLKFAIHNENNEIVEIEITSEDFPVGKQSDNGDVVVDDTIAVIIKDTENLHNFDAAENFSDAIDAAQQYPIVILQQVQDMSVDYMQGICNGIYFYA